MKFTVKKHNKHIANIMRGLGYRLLGRQREGEWSFVKSLTGGPYPRFHVYITQQKGDMLAMNLHMDQKNHLGNPFSPLKPFSQNLNNH